MGQPRIEYLELEEGNQGKGGVQARVYAANGEGLFPTEVYANKSNADRGLAEIARAVLWLVAEGKIKLDRAT